jgi:transcription-repair coupling factor (superfamily II helicase)
LRPIISSAPTPVGQGQWGFCVCFGVKSKSRILSAFKSTGAYEQSNLLWSQGSDNIRVAQLSGSSRTFLLSGLFEDRPGRYIFICKSERDAQNTAHDINEILGYQAAFNFPSLDTPPYQWKSPAPETIGSRLEALLQLTESRPAILTVSVRGICEPTISPDDLASSSLSLNVNQDIVMENVISKLIDLGYDRMPIVEEVGTFAVRGGIVDIFPNTSEHPVRIEFFGDFIESIREFAVASQRSTDTLESVRLFPQREIPINLSELDEILEGVQNKEAADILREKFRFGIDYPGLEWASSLFLRKRFYLIDYLRDNDFLYIVDTDIIEAEIDSLTEELQFRYEDADPDGNLLPTPDSIFLNPDLLRSLLESHRSIVEIAFSSLRANTISFKTEDHPIINAQMRVLLDKLDEYLAAHNKVFITCDNRVQLERMEEMIGERAGRCDLSLLDLSNGFLCPAGNFVVLCDHEIFARRFHRHRVRRSKEGVALSSYTNLDPGDYVVHVDYGIGRYRGLKEITVDKRRRDCLLIMYEGDDKLYVPIEEFNRVQKYVGKEGKPRLTKLGGTSWEKVKARTKKAIADMAEELIKLYAERRSKPGFAYSPDDNMMRQLEASFPYDETPDQLTTIEDLKRDMESRNPMDRLICGDVGFGKTEVAIRAAFKAVNDGKQVAVLVPTTILAQQHLNTFAERLIDLPVKVEMLSRFRTRTEQKNILRDLAEGRIDVIVGTHRLLSKDIEFRDLGLLVVDEEQRFGVAHKEKIKKLKRLVDAITMTATPIPRTLQMSLLGARDMSIINTSPKDRLPIRTEILEFDPQTIRSSILAEIERGGQVYFVHNRVQTILSIKKYLERLLPGIRICVGHGQMPEKELEEVMYRFLLKDYDVLLSTSIIESGLDIPSVNTIVINRADRFGLAQLYQLRGRVGRSTLKAVAYMLIPPVRLLTNTARKRLKAIEQHTELGSGYHLALKDLEIRGAGNLLGAQQHGFIEEVGFDLYLRLLDEAVSQLRGDSPRPSLDIRIDTDVDLYLPNEYVGDTRQKVNLYQRLAQADSYESVNELEREMIDRFGPLPLPAENLIRMAEVKVLAARTGISKVVFRDSCLRLTYAQQVLPGKRKIAALATHVPDPLEFSAGDAFEITVDMSGGTSGPWHTAVKNVLQNLMS